MPDPLCLHAMIKLLDIPNSVESRLGMPRLVWDVIIDWVDENVPEAQRDDAWQQLAEQWLAVLKESLPRPYSVERSESFLALCGVSDLVAPILSWCEHYDRKLRKILAGIAREDGQGPIILHFHCRETYLDYVMDIYPETGEFADSGGMYLHYGFPHLAIWGQNAVDLERTIAHELSHDLLSHLPLPLWLNEGVTQVAEEMAMESSQFLMSPEIARQHREHWNPASIQRFWSGESFHGPGDEQRLSYSLAQVLIRNLMSDYPRKVAEFVRQANPDDSGDGALLATCGVSLESRVSQFLGAADWNPRSFGSAG